MTLWLRAGATTMVAEDGRVVDDEGTLVAVDPTLFERLLLREPGLRLSDFPPIVDPTLPRLRPLRL